MDNSLTFIMLLLGCGAITEVNSQKWPTTMDNRRFSVSRSNDINAGDVYRQVSSKAQMTYPWSYRNSKEMPETEETIEHENEELLKLLLDNSVTTDYEKLDLIGDHMISRANVSEETKRVARQVKKKRPGFFWTIFRVTFETVNETRAAINRINEIIDMNIYRDTTTSRSNVKATTRTTTTSKPETTVSPNKDMNETTTTTTTTTTKEPYRLTIGTLQNLVRRNIQGLVRLFNIEWRDAINQSQISIRQFQNELGKSAQPFLEDNPAAYR